MKKTIIALSLLLCSCQSTSSFIDTITGKKAEEARNAKKAEEQAKYEAAIRTGNSYDNAKAELGDPDVERVEGAVIYAKFFEFKIMLKIENQKIASVTDISAETGQIPSSDPHDWRLDGARMLTQGDSDHYVRVISFLYDQKTLNGMIRENSEKKHDSEKEIRATIKQMTAELPKNSVCFFVQVNTKNDSFYSNLKNWTFKVKLGDHYYKTKPLNDYHFAKIDRNTGLWSGWLMNNSTVLCSSQKLRRPISLAAIPDGNDYKEFQLNWF